MGDCKGSPLGIIDFGSFGIDSGTTMEFPSPVKTLFPLGVAYDGKETKEG